MNQNPINIQIVYCFRLVMEFDLFWLNRQRNRAIDYSIETNELFNIDLYGWKSNDSLGSILFLG